MSHHKTFRPPKKQLSRHNNVNYLALHFLQKYKLDQEGWTFGFEDYGGHIGDCRYDLKRITFSNQWMHISWDEIRDTILHEIAHALVGSKHNHDVTWQEMAIRLGCRPTACAPPEVKRKGA